MMKKIYSVGFISLSLAFVNFSYSIKNTQAQTEIKPNVEINNSNLDDLLDDPNQMFSWR